MKRVFKIAVFTFCLAAFSHAAVVPVQNLTPWSLAAEYQGMLHGHEGLYDFDSSALASHFLRLHYAPCFFLRFTAGIGGSHAYAEPSIKGTKAGFSATAGFGLYTPRLFDFLTITAGYDGYYLKASEKQNYYHSGQFGVLLDDAPATVDTLYVGVAREGNTAAALHIPYLGARFHIGRHFDVEVGGLYQYFDIMKKNLTERNAVPFSLDGVTTILIEDVVRTEISDGAKLADQFRAYAAMTIHERESGAYLTGGFSVALPMGDNQVENKSHLTNFSFWAQIGLMMRDPRGDARAAGFHSREYARLKARQDRMAAALQRDHNRDRCREERKDKGECASKQRGECPLADDDDNE